MRLEVRLFASLRDKRPDAPRGRAMLEMPDGASLQDLLEHLDVHAKEAQMVLVNGVQMPRAVAERRAHALEPGDVVAIFPPLAGG